MPSLPRGLYEELITEALEARLTKVSAQLHTRRRPLHEAEAADRISLHLAREIKRALACLKDKDRVTEGVELARKIMDLVETAIPDSEADARLEASASLRGGRRKAPDEATPSHHYKPHSAPRVMAFIRRSG